MATPESLRKWIRQTEIDSGQRQGVSSEESAEIRKLRAEVREFRRANEILKAASALADQAGRPKQARRTGGCFPRDLPLRSEANCCQPISRSMTSAPRRSSGTITFR